MIKHLKVAHRNCSISEMEEKLLSNHFSALGVDYYVKRNDDPSCISGVVYVPEIRPSFFINSFVLNVAVSFANNNQETEMIIETSLLPVMKRVIYCFAFILFLFQITLIVMLLKNDAGFNFSYLIPSGLLLFLFALVFAGKNINNIIIVRRINRIVMNDK